MAALTCKTCTKKFLGDKRRRYCDECRPTKQHLHPVGRKERRPKPRTLTVDQAAKNGSELELLMAMRDRIAVQVADPNCPARDLAALTRRLREISKDIEALRLKEREEAIDAEDVPDEAWNAEAI